ncbi:hypothetical protein [Thalassobacterium maritimum]|uniref:hypothetical protein n=1 Tax=Thalassobacterium maritimum TaxID=3041265 RepID=UPI003CE5C196
MAYTGNLRRRLFEHNTGEARATSFRRPWKLIYYEAYVLEEVLEVADSVRADLVRRPAIPGK